MMMIPALSPRPALFALALTMTLPMAAEAEEPLHVLATVGMIGDLAARIGGDCATVATLIGPGADPHLYTPAPSDLRSLQQAEIVLYGGLHLEGQLGEVLEKLSHSRTVLAVSEAAVPEADRLTTDGQPDPHVWMDAALWARTVPVIAAAFSAERPDCADGFAARAAALHDQITALDGWARTSLTTIPEAQRDLVTAHDAFAYFGRAYGMRVTAIQGISTTSEAAIADLDAVAAHVAAAGIPAVFVESTINPRTITALVEAVAARGGSVTVGGELLADALGPEGHPSGSYIGMVRQNITTITTALGGTPAALPPQLEQ